MGGAGKGEYWEQGAVKGKRGSWMVREGFLEEGTFKASRAGGMNIM